MKTCKDCFHHNVCYRIEHYGRDMESSDPCGDFKDNALIFETPCEIGRQIFARLGGGNVYAGFVCSFSIQPDGLWFYARYECGLCYWYKTEDIGKTVFFSKSEAGKAAKESVGS